MMMIYDPTNWYWVVGTNTTTVWSSNAKAYVPTTDPSYLSFGAAGGIATPISSEADLAEVFREQYPAGWPALVPDSVSMRQAQLALLAIGQLAAVNAAVAAQPQATQVAWAASATVQRNDPMVNSMATALGIDLDTLFKTAITL